MRKFMMFMVLLTTSAPLFAQVTINGKVKDNRGRPVTAATITLKDTYDGAVADSMGNYRFTTTEKGSFLLQFSCTGYRSFEQQITIGGTAIVIDAVLKEELNELKAVTVMAGSFAAGDNKELLPCLLH
jgi:hypothetical protein